MWIGLALYAIAVILLILAPTGSIPFVIVYVFVVAVAGSLVMPRKDALIQLNINAEERARINALIMSFTIAFSSPFGYFAGWLSSIDRRLPFMFSFALFLVAIIIVGRIRDPEFSKQSFKEQCPLMPWMIETLLWEKYEKQRLVIDTKNRPAYNYVNKKIAFKRADT